MSEITFADAHPGDMMALTLFLAECGLSSRGLHNAGACFFTAKEGATLVGIGGIEIRGPVALVRSVAVHKDFRRRKIGTALLQRIEAYAGAQQVTGLYAVTGTAADAFVAWGYQPVDRASFPAVLQSAGDVASGLLADAACLYKRLEAAPAVAVAVPQPAVESPVPAEQPAVVPAPADQTINIPPPPAAAVEPETQYPAAVQSLVEHAFEPAPQSHASSVPSSQCAARLFERAVLEFRVLNPGVQAWTAGIENARISYAEYAPDSSGDPQQNDAAVIIYVINGALLVETGGTVTAVAKGEVIAIPAHSLYRTFTREQAALTITAWTSPL